MTMSLYTNSSSRTIAACLALLWLLSTSISSAFEYAVASTEALRLVDVTTNISDIYTLHRNKNATVHVDGVTWKASNITDSQALKTARIAYYTYINDDLVTSGSHDVSSPGTVPPSSVEAGTIEMGSAGRHNITVLMQIEYENQFFSSKLEKVATTRFYQCYRSWVTIFPVLVLVLLAYSTGNVEISLSTTNLVIACIVKGNFFRGTRYLVGGYLLGALIKPENGTVVLLVFFFGGIMTLIEASGGSRGFVKFVVKYIKTIRVVQCIAYGLGFFYFWDDTMSVLIVGFLMRPVLDMANTSRPLVALILDATASPMASLAAVSTWLAWEIPLLRQEVARLGLDDVSATILTPSQIFRDSLRYAYYPIFYVTMMPLLLWTQRHFGPQLVAERTTQVYHRKDGGPPELRGPLQAHLPVQPGTPCRFWNICFPLGVISLFFILTWLQTGLAAVNRNPNNDNKEANWVNIVANADVQAGWLQSVSFGTTLFVIIILLQWRRKGEIILLPLNIGKIKKQRKQLMKEAETDYRDEEDTKHLTPPREIMKPLLPLMDIISNFFFGFSRVMPFVIQFILAWSVRQGMIDVGLERWMATCIGENFDKISTGSLPTVAFLIAFWMSFFIGGASRGTVATILLPMLVKPVFERTYATDPDLMYQVIGAVFSGCAAGDHASPVSNSSLLAVLASECHLKAHVFTQAPYVIFIIALSVLFGTLPVGYGAYPNGVCYGLGFVFLVLFVLFICVPVLDPAGDWDIFTKLFLRLAYGPTEDDDEFVSGNPLEKLRQDTIKASTVFTEQLPTKGSFALCGPEDDEDLAITTSDDAMNPYDNYHERPHELRHRVRHNESSPSSSDSVSGPGSVEVTYEEDQNEEPYYR